MFWWFPALANQVIERLQDACAEEIRPLLGLRHVTVRRAQTMRDALQIRTVRDVAALFPPDRLAEKVPFLGKWRAAEIILDARVRVHRKPLL